LKTISLEKPRAKQREEVRSMTCVPRYEKVLMEEYIKLEKLKE
jgi:hypothetical protein